MKIRKSQTEKLRELLIAKEFIPVPSCFDTLSAKLIEQANFDVTFMSGFAASASRIGSPDLGLMTFSEVFDQANNICNAIDIPMIVDGDTGYGNAMNVRRTLKECSKAGCAGILIEDQLAPKRCGHTPGKDVVGRDEAFDRIRAANDMRNEGYDILIMARTDANHTHGLNEAIERAQKFFDLGADILFVEAPKNLTELKAIPSSIQAPQVANMVFGGLTPEPGREVLASMGYSIVLYANAALQTAIQALSITLSSLRDTGSLAECSDLLASFDKRQAVVQKEKWDEFERKHN